MYLHNTCTRYSNMLKLLLVWFMLYSKFRCVFTIKAIHRQNLAYVEFSEFQLLLAIKYSKISILAVMDK